MFPMNCSISGWDAFTISAPVLHRILPVTQRSVDRATTRRTTEPTQRTEATENVIRFHREGILGDHGVPRKVTRRRAATAQRTTPPPWVYFKLRKDETNHGKIMQIVIPLGGVKWVTGGETESMAVKEISYWEKLYPCSAPGSCPYKHTRTHSCAYTHKYIVSQHTHTLFIQGID